MRRELFYRHTRIALNVRYNFVGELFFLFLQRAPANTCVDCKLDVGVAVIRIRKLLQSRIHFSLEALCA